MTGVVVEVEATLMDDGLKLHVVSEGRPVQASEMVPERPLE